MNPRSNRGDRPSEFVAFPDPWPIALRDRSNAVECGDDCSEIVGDFARDMLMMRNMQITVVTWLARLHVSLPLWQMFAILGFVALITWRFL